MGIFVGPLYAMFQSLPQDNGFYIAPKQFSAIAIAVGISQGANPMIVGTLMDHTFQ